MEPGSGFDYLRLASALVRECYSNRESVMYQSDFIDIKSEVAKFVEVMKGVRDELGIDGFDAGIIGGWDTLMKAVILVDAWKVEV